MRLNQAVIPHYRSEMIPIERLKRLVALNEKYLREKPTWYIIDDKLKYFKIRNDFRLFTEQFFSIFAKKIIGLDTINYQVAYVRTISQYGKSSEEVTKCGLLSNSFQDCKHNYYLVSELMNAEISDFVFYGGYTLENLLKFFKDQLTIDDYTKNELFLIKLFIADAFTNQEDRNYHNIGFEIPKILGVSHNIRLHPERLALDKKNHQFLEDNGNNHWKLKGLSPTKVYDSERILGIDHHRQFKYIEGDTWKPIFPYTMQTSYISKEAAKKDSLENFEGLDPNLLSLYIDHPEICQPIFERLAYDDEYRKILELFKGNNAQITLSQNSIDYFTLIFEDKREVFKRILKYGR